MRNVINVHLLSPFFKFLNYYFLKINLLDKLYNGFSIKNNEIAKKFFLFYVLHLKLYNSNKPKQKYICFR